MKIRRNQKDLTQSEWDNFVEAFKAIKQGLFKGVDKPSLDDFADEHAKAFKDKFNHLWQVHTHFHNGEIEHKGIHFFAWHRQFLSEFESRLRREVSSVTIPYWNAFKDPFPEELKKITDNEGEDARLTTSNLPDFSLTNFEDFQENLELNYHNPVHGNLGQTVARRHSPRDASFWLHHAFVDRQWGHWFEKHNGTLPATMNQKILGDEIIKGKLVRDVLHTAPMGFVYGNGVFGCIDKKGSDTATLTLVKDMILAVKLNDDYFAKIKVWALSKYTATLIIKSYPNCIPGEKTLNFISETMYYKLDTNTIRVSENEGHLKFDVTEKSDGSKTYKVKPVNGVKIAEFTGITDFTGNNGEGTTDFDMMYI